VLFVLQCESLLWLFLSDSSNGPGYTVVRYCLHHGLGLNIMYSFMRSNALLCYQIPQGIERLFQLSYLTHVYLSEGRLVYQRTCTLPVPYSFRMRTDGDDPGCLGLDLRYNTPVPDMSYRFVLWVSPEQYRTLIQETVYYYVITNFDNPTILTHMVW